MKAWVERCAKDPVVLEARCGLDFDPRLPANCAAMQKMVGKYFKHQADLLPSFVDEVLAPYDAFASGVRLYSPSKMSMSTCSPVV